MIYEGELKVEEYPIEQYAREVCTELCKMKPSFVPFYNFMTLEIWIFKHDKVTKFYETKERFPVYKFKDWRFSPLDCAIIIKALTEYGLEQHN